MKFSIPLFLFYWDPFDIAVDNEHENGIVLFNKGLMQSKGGAWRMHSNLKTYYIGGLVVLTFIR